MNEQPIITGALLGRGEYDWQAGANSPIKRVELMKDGNWKSVSIPNEIQFLFAGTDYAYDTLMCVSFNGTTDAIEYIMMQQLRLGMIPNWKVNWLKEKGYFENGVLNFNERFIAIMGETTSQGAYVYKVANAMRNYGLIPQKMFPYAKNFKDNIDRKFVTQEMLDLGAEFKKLFQINFEWVPEAETKEFMKYSPLAVTGRFGNMEGDAPIDPQNNLWHSMLQVTETADYREIDDSYWQQFKKYKKTALSNFLAYYVDASDNTMFDRAKFIKEHDLFIIRNTSDGTYGVIYHNEPLLITPERAGLFMIDRDARGLVGANKEAQLNAQDWLALKVVNKF
jgi:hypothetical protein